jgi:diacylglycerol kinase family enzyme
MAHDLGISLILQEAAELIVNSDKRRAIDLAKIGDQVFMLRAYAGLSADIAASREDKDKYGQLAYVQSALNFLRYVPEAHYKATVDGEVIEGEALTVFILNAGTIGGVMSMELPSVGDVDISDGFLDLYSISKSIKPIRAVSQHIFKQKGADTGVYHWRGKEITIEANPVQDVWIDGELAGQTPFTVSALPKALEIVVPA